MKESIGKALKKIRESKQLSIEYVSEKTRIPKKILFDIEEDRLLDIGSPFYTRGFAKSYAQFLGALDEKVVEEFLKTSAKRGESVPVLRGEKLPGDWLLKHRKKIASLVFGVFLAWFLFFSLVQVGKFVKNSFSKVRASFAEKRENKTIEPVPEKKVVQGSDFKKVDTKPEGVELSLEAKTNSWVQVEGDDRLLFKGILKKGTKDTWHAEKEIKLSLGNAGGVRLNLNGRDLGYLGRKGEIKRDIVVMKDGIKK